MPTQTPRVDTLVLLAPSSCGLNEMAEQYNKMLALARELETALTAAQASLEEAKKEAYRLGWEARGKELTQNDKRWRILEHGCRFVRFDPVDGDGHSFDPRNLTGYDGDLNHMRRFADGIVERHLKILRDAIAREGT